MSDSDGVSAADTNPDDAVQDDTGRKREPLRSVLYWASLPLISLALVLAVRATVAAPYRIPSESMLPTIEVGDRVLINRLSYHLGEVERGQVVVFERPPLFEGEDDLIKRIVGLPGETVRFKDAEVYVDGQLVVEPYLVEPSSTETRPAIPGCMPGQPLPGVCIVPDGHVFVMGDNRDSSVDSRSFGPIPIDTIIGRAFWRIWPATDLAQI